MSDDDRVLSVLRLITEERERQVRIGYTHEIDATRSVDWWVRALQVELGELAAVSMHDHSDPEWKKRWSKRAMVQIAAVCVAALEVEDG